MKKIYLDYNATTPVDPKVSRRDARLAPDDYGNPSSTHWAGRPRRTLWRESRAKVAALLGCRADQIVFTSGGSEANNFAIKGLCFARGGPTHAHRHQRNRNTRRFLSPAVSWSGSARA